MNEDISLVPGPGQRSEISTWSFLSV